MKLLSTIFCFGGEQRLYEVDSVFLKTKTKFNIFLPKNYSPNKKYMCLFFLAGLTCNEETFFIKAHPHKIASELNIIIVTPDTSPRGENIPVGDHWDIGIGASYYLDAKIEPWKNNYQMESYISKELYNLVIDNFNISPNLVGIFGHSMGGHGALYLGLKYPDKFKSISAFSPIFSLSRSQWGIKALKNYIGSESEDWNKYDVYEILRSKKINKSILIDQGVDDEFNNQLSTNLIEHKKIILRKHLNYNHGYYFIQSFIDDHLLFHYKNLKG